MLFEPLILILLLIGTYTDIKSFYVSNWIAHTIILLSLPILNLSNSYQIPDTTITIENTLLYPIAFAIIILIIYYIGQKYAIPTILSADVKVIIPLMFTFNILELACFFGFIILAGIILITYFLLKTKINPTQIPLAGFIPITISYFLVKFVVMVV